MSNENINKEVVDLIRKGSRPTAGGEELLPRLDRKMAQDEQMALSGV